MPSNPNQNRKDLAAMRKRDAANGIIRYEVRIPVYRKADIKAAADAYLAIHDLKRALVQ